jgi:hypothetical protein
LVSSWLRLDVSLRCGVAVEHLVDDHLLMRRGKGDVGDGGNRLRGIQNRGPFAKPNNSH